ncbi:VOC family protein [Paenibacillus cellulositrophicus]|uniref:Catechol 2,3-dioxygenase n=1 Tax=Paenibacillus favisporus TaxID=221028 RepID=A0ABV2FB97_9BACL|nr:VOC family protein [Paenibacillus sp. VMFN-D1]RED31392.1 catechol 2,3-dioxygenase [Paenibacillus sp. VMFN-D1]
MHPEMKLGPVKIKISRMDRSIAFYTEIIGLEVLKREGSTAELGPRGSASPILILEELEDAVIVPERSHAGLYHFAILLPSREHLGTVVRHFIQTDTPFGQGDHAVSEAIYLSDPDQNGIEVYADRPRDTWRKEPNGNYVMVTEAVDLRGLLEQSAGLEWQGLPAGTVIGHVHFHVGSLPEAKRFYCDILGFDVVGDYARMRALFISAGGYHHHVGLNIWAGAGAPPVPANGTGIDYMTIVLPGAREVEELVQQVREAGMAAEEQEEGAFLVRDPWNIGVRLTSAGRG